jgi:hypothetical protein
MQPMLDRYRIYSLMKIITKDGNSISYEQHQRVMAVLRKKCLIYANGCEKRGRFDEAAYYRGLAASA